MSHHPNNVTTYQLPFAAIAIVLATLTHATAEETVVDRDGQRFFTRKIEPMLKAHCFACHSHAGTIESGLALDSRSGWAEGGARGPAIVPGKPAESLLIKAVRHGNDAKLSMPPDEKLSDENLELLVHWIARGAPDPRKSKLVTRSLDNPLDWWSLRPLQRPVVPQPLWKVLCQRQARLPVQVRLVSVYTAAAATLFPANPRLMH